MEYTPDQWQIIKINGTHPHYRIFGSWSGGYLDGDSWRLNSGIQSIEEDGDYYLFHGFSGSTYRCHKKTYGVRSPWNHGVMKDLCENSHGTMEYLRAKPKNIEDIVEVV
jgi:hypothetical protein